MYLAVGHTVLLSGRHVFVGFLSDITEQKLNEKRLAEAKDAAEAGAKTKAAFVANMSHEIRTPMNAILGFSEVVLQDPNLSSDSLKNVRTIFSAAKSLLGIINDVLDVSKMESGKFSLESVCFNLYNVLGDSIRTIESKAAEKDLILGFEYDSQLPIRVMGDPTRLRQVILNLVGNSIKFTEAGSVKLVVKAGKKPDTLQFSIVDTGIGMTQEQIATVFEAFSQADASTTRRFGGTGLGTSISKQIVELMDGRIWVESVYGEGTTFHFTAHLPVATDTKGCLFEDSSIVEEGYVSPRLFNILLAEDIAANATLATLRLEQQGHNIHWAKNGREAVEAFKYGGHDLILMDVQMPELDGLGATREIRELEKSSDKKRLTILALTASVLHEERQECIDAGMDGVVGKPINFGELLSVMEKTIPERIGRIRTVEQFATKATITIDFSPLDGVIDHEKGLKTWIDALAYTKALKSFAEERRDASDKIAAALDNAAEIRQIAHAVKGVSGNLAMINVPAIAGEIEAMAISGEKENLDTLLLKLNGALAQVCSAIDKLQLPITQQAAATLSFDNDAVCQLFRELIAALEELNPDAVEPVISGLSAYLDEKELTKIRREIDNFDFEEATNQTNALVKKLELIIE
jgi:CheY-like chemotaxis protein